MIRKVRYSSIVFITAVFFSLLPNTACKKVNNCNGVPNVSVYFTVNIINTPALNSPGGSAVFSGGYNNNGVLVYCYQMGNYLAYDCTCPYDGETNAKALIVAQAGGIYAVCPVCGSSFLLSNGSPNKGPSTCPLKSYPASINQTNNTITVQN